MARTPRYDEDEDDAPWLAEVEPDRRSRTMVPRRRLAWGAVLVVLLLAVIVGGVAYIMTREREGGSSQVAATNPAELPLIPAPPGPYKVRPSDDGGMTVEGTDELIYEASEGGTPGGAIDVGGLAEEPLSRPGGDAVATDPTLPAAIPPARGPQDLLPPGVQMDTSPPPAATPPVALPRVLRPLPPKPAADPKVEPARAAAGSASLQLGAFSSGGAADAAWKSLSGRYAYLGGLRKVVGTTSRDGKTLYRLRATGVADAATAADLCARLKVAGEECLVAE